MSRRLSRALEAARAQITQDADHATKLSKDLATAKKKLRSLEKSIRAARLALARQPTVTVTTVATTRTATTSGGERDDEGHEEHDDD